MSTNLQQITTDLLSVAARTVDLQVKLDQSQIDHLPCVIFKPQNYRNPGRDSGSDAMMFNGGSLTFTLLCNCSSFHRVDAMKHHVGSSELAWTVMATAARLNDLKYFSKYTDNQKVIQSGVKHFTGIIGRFQASRVSAQTERIRPRSVQPDPAALDQWSGSQMLHWKKKKSVLFYLCLNSWRLGRR